MEFDGKTEKELTRDDIKAPEGWLWKTDWAIDKNRAVDEEGMCVCVCVLRLNLCAMALLQSLLSHCV